MLDKVEEKSSEKPLSFPEFLELNNYSDNTVNLYMTFYKMLDGKEITQRNINDLLLQHNYPLAYSFCRTYLFKFLKRKDIDVDMPRGRKKARIPKYLSYNEVMYLADNVDLRSSLLIRLLFETGLRISECLAVTPGDINIDDCSINGIGKGRKEYVVFFSPKTKEMMLQYVEERHISDNEERLFDLSIESARDILKKDSLELLGREITPHALRHSCATYLISQGFSLQEVQLYLRHESIETTAIYSHLSKEELQGKIRRMFK